ncbi:MAG: class I SAM-dependent methyltransferase [Chitinispirillaceae bacterium]|nr:class I SAM-dependent methyltransferase [Chitinispirillaceae bacterium]
MSAIQNDEKRNFDKDAASWDANPARVKMAEDIIGAIVRRIVLTTEMDVMDFGCGTGLLSIGLLPFVRSVTGVDSSAGMIEVFKKKAAARGLNGIAARLVDIEKGETLSGTGSYDLVTSSMTMHHVKELPPLFNQFHSVLNSGGHLCIADIDPDGGQFHSDDTGVFHFGFDRNSLRKIFIAAGFDDITHCNVAEVEKPARNGEMRRFTIFLMIGRKRHPSGALKNFNNGTSQSTAAGSPPS